MFWPLLYTIQITSYPKTSAEKKAALLEKYDVNKDGKLDSEEKAKMKEDLKKQREEERAKRHASRKAD